MELPEGVKAVWGLAEAYRESTPTRERVCINGLWRWQPAGDDAAEVPADGWGYFHVPGEWPRDYTRGGSQVLYAHPGWGDESPSSVKAAWYQREITIPKEWAGRSITVRAQYVNSVATVHVDGRKAGTIRFPWGTVDLTSACRPGETHVLSILVVPVPLDGLMLSFSDSASSREVKGSVARRGLCGDVYLVGAPKGARIADVKVDTSVRNWEITFEAALENVAANMQYRLRAEITENGRKVADFTSKPIGKGDLQDGRVSFGAEWQPEKLWDTHTPQNLYDIDLSLLDGDGAVLDAALPVRCGFREFWIEGRDFYMNGTRIFLSAVPLDNAQLGAGLANYAAVVESLKRLMSFGVNFVYTHNYGCEPGSHLSFEEALRAADDVGMLVSLSQPHFGHYDWEALDADEANGYAGHAEFYVRVAQNHPSVVAYSTSHNATGYAEDMNPFMIDGVQNPRDDQAQENAERALRAEAIVKRMDPGRLLYHHHSGNLSSMHTINFYANFAPVQEMSDWFEHWATEGTKPVFTCEYSVPFTWDWTMYRGWYDGTREFGSAAVPWEFCLAEWNAQFLGDTAFQVSDMEKANLRWEAEQLRAGKVWYRWDYPYKVGSRDLDERFPVMAMYITDNWRAFRTWGMSATSPWEHSHYWKPRVGADHGRRDLPVEWEALQRPGLCPTYIEQPRERMDLAYERSDWIDTLPALALYRNNMPLLAYIAGKPDRFTSKDHNFLPGETVEKQIIVINNSRETVACDCQWSLDLPSAVTGRAEATLPTGGQERIPLSCELPRDLAPGRYELSATIRFSSGESQEDSFAFDVLPPCRDPEVSSKVALFDPRGETAALLDGMGVAYDRVDAAGDLSAHDMLIIGKGALTLDAPAPAVERVRDGLKVVMFEQTAQVLEKRFGFRVAEYGLRQVFRRVLDHSILTGIGDEHLRDWRGEATTSTPRLDYELDPQLSHAPTVQWCGIPVTRLWRCGNRGNVASALIEKPACGDFLSILDGGYGLQYSCLMEYREGKGMVLFCQMDVNGRTETDPAGEILARNILQYASDWTATPRRKVIYVGDPRGKEHLEACGLAPGTYDGRPGADQVLVVSPGGGQELAGSAADIADWLTVGGHVLVVGLDEAEANAFLPFEIEMRREEHIAAYFGQFATTSLLAGVAPADVHNRDPRDLPLISSGPTVIGNGVLGLAEDANIVFCQLAPWLFEHSGEKMNTKRTFRRTSCLLSRLLANMGAAGRTRLLEHVSRAVTDGESRWLDGLYLDVPEEWDDPYRFFRW